METDSPKKRRSGSLAGMTTHFLVELPTPDDAWHADPLGNRPKPRKISVIQGHRTPQHCRTAMHRPNRSPESRHGRRSHNVRHHEYSLCWSGHLTPIGAALDQAPRSHRTLRPATSGGSPVSQLDYRAYYEPSWSVHHPVLNLELDPIKEHLARSDSRTGYSTSPERRSVAHQAPGSGNRAVAKVFGTRVRL
jgi:hypothetical protein